MKIIYLIVPVIGALIGWFTNVLAIKFIFRPYHVIRIPGTSIGIQGVIPKRRHEIASSIGKVVETELLSLDDLLPHFENGVTSREFVERIVFLIRAKIMQRMPPFIPQGIRDVFGKVIEDILFKELPLILPDMVRQGLGSLSKDVHIRDIVEEKINNLELQDFEAMIINVTRRELKHIEYLGALLGFMIGLFQALMIYLL